jgi:hypothetical protein
MSESQSRDYKRIITFVGIAAGLGLLLMTILDYIHGFLYYGILLLITVIVSIIGYVGGLWLWEYLATSELMKEDFRKLVKRVGVFALIGFIGLISVIGYLAFTAEIQFLHSIIKFVNWLMLFMVAYNTGYLLSIWRESPVSETEVAGSTERKVKVDWEIIKAVLKIAAPSLFIIMGSTLTVGIIQGMLDFVLTAIGLQLLLFGGFCIGYIIWEHLKKTNLISGDFRTQLRWISVIFMLVIGALTIYGFVVSYDIIIAEILRQLMLYYAIFLICMFFYFLGLYVSLMKSE